MTTAKGKFLPTLKALGLWCLKLIKKNIKVFYVAICMILALLTISLVSTTIAYNVSDVASFDDGISELPYHGYTTSVGENGKVVYTPINGDPQLYFTMSGSAEFNTVTVHFAEPIDPTSIIQVYYSILGEELSEPCSVKARVSLDAKTVSLVLPQVSTYTLLRIDVDSQFTLDSITLENTELIGMQRGLKIGVVIALAVLLAILAGVEKWFGFYRFIWSLVKKCYTCAKELLVQRKYVSFVIRALLILACAALCISYAVILMTIAISLSVIAYLFILSAITAALFIADRIISGNFAAPVMFLVLTVICSFMICATLPIEVSNSWDEEFHYAKCVEMKILLFGNEETYADVWQARRDFAVTTDRYLRDIDKFVFDLLDYDQIKYEGSVKAPEILKCVGHIPGAIAMACADATDLNYFALFVISKMANALVYAFVIYLGLKKLKSGALLVSSIALMPTAVFLASTFSYDFFITAFAIYSFTYFISELQNPDKKLTLKDCILMLGSFFLACGPKAVYFLLLFPMLFMPKEKFASKKSRKIYICAVIIIALLILASFLLPFLISNGDGFSDDRGGTDVNALEQVKFILKNPLKYTKILLTFIGDYVSLINASNFVASYSYVGTGKAFWATLSLCVVGFCAITDKSKHDLFKGNRLVRATSAFACFACVCFVATALYINFTPVGFFTVSGCQWRYIIPVLLPFLYSIGSPKIEHKISPRILSAAVFGALSLSIFMTFYDAYISTIFQLI